MPVSLDDVKKTIRALLNSASGRVTVKDLCRDYKDTEREDLPFKDFNFRNPLEFLRSLRNDVNVHNPQDPNSTISVVPSAKSSHIREFVLAQKKAPTRSNRPNFYSFRGRPRVKKPITYEFRSELFNLIKNYPNGVQLHDFKCIVERLLPKHNLAYTTTEILNNISDFSYQQSSKVYIKREKLQNDDDTREQHNYSKQSYYIDKMASSGSSDSVYHDDYSPDESDFQYFESSQRECDKPKNKYKDDYGGSGGTTTNPIVNENLIKHLRILLEENENGIWLEQLNEKYEKRFRYPLPLTENGFHDVTDLVFNLPDVFHAHKYTVSGSHCLTDARKHKNESTDTVKMELPKWFVDEVKVLLKKRKNQGLYTDDLLTHYRTTFSKSLSYESLGFETEDALLKHLHDTCHDIMFKENRNRTLMILISDDTEQPTVDERRGDAVPDSLQYDPLPVNVCNIDFILKEDPDLEDVQVGSEFPIILGELYSPAHFYIHFEKKYPVLESMMGDLDTFYNTHENIYEVLPATVTRSLLCVCKYSGNNRWHRARVIQLEKTSVKVYYLDYGTTAKIDIGELRYLHKDYAKLPAMCKKVKLLGIQPKPDLEKFGTYSRAVIDKFYSMCYDNGYGNLHAKLITIEASCWGVIVHLKTKTGEKIFVHEQLIQKDLVDPKEIIYHSEVSEADLVNGTPPPKATIQEVVANCSPKSEVVPVQPNNVYDRPLSPAVKPKKSKNVQGGPPPPGFAEPMNIQLLTAIPEPEPRTFYVSYNNPNILPVQSQCMSYYNIPASGNFRPPPGLTRFEPNGSNMFLPPIYPPFYFNSQPLYTNPQPAYASPPQPFCSSTPAPPYMPTLNSASSLNQTQSYMSPVAVNHTKDEKFDLFPDCKCKTCPENSKNSKDNDSPILKKLMELLHANDAKKTYNNNFSENEREQMKVEMKVRKYLDSCINVSGKAGLSDLDSRSACSQDPYSKMTDDSLITAKTMQVLEGVEKTDNVRSQLSSTKLCKLKAFVKQYEPVQVTHSSNSTYSPSL